MSVTAASLVAEVGVAGETAAATKLVSFGKKVDETAAKSERSASRFAAAFHGADAQLRSFGVPFADTLGRVGTVIERTEGQGKSFGSVLSRIGDVEATAAAVGLVAVGSEAVHLGDALELAHAREVTAIDNAGQAYGDYAGEISKTDTQMEKFGFTNADTESSIANLTNATHDARKAIADEALAADISRGRKIDLASATAILMKVETGHVALLGRLGINIKDVNGNTISQEEALRRLSATYQGQAAASADTFAGKMKTLSATVQDLGAKLGEAIVPKIEATAAAASAGVTKFEGFNAALAGVPGKLLAIAVAAPLVVTAIQRVDAAAATLPIVGASLSGVFPLVAGAAIVAAGGIEAVRVSANALQKDVSTTSKSTRDLADGLEALGKSAGRSTSMVTVTDQLGTNFEKLAHAMKVNDSETTGWAGRFGDGVTKILGITTDVQQKIKQTQNALVDLFHTDPRAAYTAFEKIRDAMIANGVSSEIVYRNFDDFLKLVAQGFPKAAGHVDTLDESLQRLNEDTLAAVTSQLALQKGNIDVASAYETSRHAGESAQLAVADSLDQVRSAQDTLTQARENANGTGEQAISAARQETSSRQALSNAIQSERDAVSGLADAKAKLAQFDAPTDTTIRSLERTQIVDRVVTNPEEDRQKRIDLLKFDEDNANKRGDLQKQVTSAERGVISATQQVATAQQSVSDAVTARRKVQTDATAAIAGDERKLAEALISYEGEVLKAASAAQLGLIGLDQSILGAVQLAEEVARKQADLANHDPTTKKTEEDIAAHKAAGVELTKLKDLYPGLTAEIDAYGVKLGLIPKTVTTRLQIDVADALAGIALTQGALRGLGTITSPDGTVGVPVHVGAHAKGGRMQPGEWGTVVEPGTGSELLHALPGGGVDIYNQQQAKAMGGGGGAEHLAMLKSINERLANLKQISVSSTNHFDGSAPASVDLDFATRELGHQVAILAGR